MLELTHDVASEEPGLRHVAHLPAASVLLDENLTGEVAHTGHEPRLMSGGDFLHSQPFVNGGKKQLGLSQYEVWVRQFKKGHEVYKHGHEFLKERFEASPPFF